MLFVINTMTALQKFLITIAIIIALGAGVYYFTIRPHGTITTTEGTATRPPGAASSPPAATLQTPDYKKPIAFSSSISADIRAQLNAELKIVQGQIAANPLNMGAWTN